MQKNRKIAASLCGLALSSLFLINNKSSVHADTVDNANSVAAMTFDEDDSAVNNASSVQNNSAVRVSKMSSANMQDKSDKSFVVNNNINSTSAQANYNAANAMGTASGSKTAHVDATESSKPITINNPANNTVHVHFVNSKGQDITDQNGKKIDVGDYDIKNMQTGQGSYSVPNGYTLNNPTGKYNISNSSYSDYQKQHGNLPIVVRDDSKGKENSMYNLTDPVVHVQFKDQNTGNVVGTQNIDLSKMGSQYYGNRYNVPAGYVDDSGTDWQFNKDQDMSYRMTITSNGHNSGHGTDDTGLSSDDIKNLLKALNVSAPTILDVAQVEGYTVYPGGSYFTDGISLTPNSSGWQGRLYNVISSHDHDGVGGFGAILNVSESPNGPVKYSFFPHNHVVESGTVIVPVHKTNIVIFNDDSGNAISFSGNTVNVALTKPQSVDPATNSQLHSSAMRTIKIDFPNNVIPPSYKNIVDSNGVLTQTVKFTRTGQMDMLTDDIIDSSLGPWKSDNSDPNFLGFPERTLPRIPGYTLSIKSA